MPFFLVAVAILVLVYLPVSAAFLLLGTKVLNVSGRSYPKALGSVAIGLVASFVLGFLLGQIPVLGGLLGIVCSFFVGAAATMLVFQTSFGRALGASLLAWACTLFVFGAIGFVSAFFVPAVAKARSNAAMTSTCANGINVYKSVFAAQMDSSPNGSPLPGFPEVGQYSSSTEYFVALVESGAICVSYAFFAAPGIPQAKSSDPKDFTAANNAWRVVAGAKNGPAGTPFLFTRNFDPPALPLDGDAIALSDSPPFGKDGLVVIRNDGSAIVLKRDMLRAQNFFPGEPSSDAPLAILSP